MRHLILVFIQLVFYTHIFSQNSYLLEFDVSKGNGGFVVHKIINSTGEKKSYKRIPKFHNGDIVKVMAFNYNPLVYHVNITTDQVITMPNIQNQTLSLISTILGQSSVIGNFLIDNQFDKKAEAPNDEFDFSTNETNNSYTDSLAYDVKDEIGKNLESDSLLINDPVEEEKELFAKNYSSFLFESEALLMDWENNFQDFNRYCLLYQELLTLYQSTYKRMLDKTTNSESAFEKIKNDFLGIQATMRNYNFKELTEKAEKIKSGFLQSTVSKPYINVEKKYLQLLQENQISPKSDYLSYLKFEYDKYHSYYQSFQKKSTEMTFQLSRPENELSEEKVNSIIRKIDQLSFSTEKIFLIKTDNENFLKSENTGVISEYQFTIELYDLNELSVKAKANSSITQKVTYWNPNFYWDANKNPTNIYKEGCKPMILAEGVINSTSIPEFEQVYYEGKLNSEICIGEWSIYGDSGQIIRKIIPPTAQLLTGSISDKNAGINSLGDEDLQSSLESKRKISIPIAGAVNLSWNTGLFAISPFEMNSKYSVKTSGQNFDSIKVISNNSSLFNFSLGTLMSIEFLSHKHLVPSLNFGVSLDLMNNQKLNYLLGMSLKPKLFPLISISGGLAYTPIQQLNSAITANTTYSASQFLSLLQNEDAVKDAYRVGFYLGLGINF
jgi:hypothetical protein